MSDGAEKFEIIDFSKLAVAGQIPVNALHWKMRKKLIIRQVNLNGVEINKLYR